MPLVMILDDRVTNRNIFARLASSIADDVRVETYGEPEEALRNLAEPPDLVITDYKMPGMNGAEFTRRFRMLPGCEDVPVIAITVYEERSFRLAALEAGATDFLLSPVDHAEFLTRARNLLQMRRQSLIIKSRACDLERELEDSERHREQLLRDSRERLAQVIDTVPACVSAFDREGICIFLNSHAAARFGVDPALAIGRRADTLFGEEAGTRSISLDQMVFRSGNALPTYEEEFTDPKGGEARVWLTTKSPLRDGESSIDAVLTSSLDITDRKKAERHLAHLAHHDALTGLPNRTFLQDRIRRELARARRGDRMFALLMLDIDRFKTVNDALGHHAGDALICAVGERLGGMLRKKDVIARLGGDEFAILLGDLRENQQAFETAETLLGALKQPFSIAGEDIVVSASIGLVLHPNDGDDVENLLTKVDIAMYRAKAEGRNVCRAFDPAMMASARGEITLEAELRHALANQEFELFYQPQIDLRSGRIIGAEALIRWRHPSRGLVRPLDFLPFAEETGLIIPINEWVIAEACRVCQGWRAGELPRLRMAVNLSPVQFRNRDMVALVGDILDRTGLDPQLLELELTETILMHDAEAVTVALRELRRRGVSISIDDFGTGYSSLAYVKKFPVDRIKIDQSFVRNMTTDPNDAAIVRAVINLGHSLGIDVIAEGVENQDQVDILRAEGCEEAQGYLFAKPLPLAEFEALVRADAAIARSA
jgi:diguanylate cyclase (GGDEF)-like protein/PAS domain S-box-containing protein